MPDPIKDAVEKAAQNVFLPETTRLDFLGVSINMKPVPIAIAKELRKLSERIETSIRGLGESPTQEQIVAADISAIDTYIDVTQRLLGYYGIPMTRDDLEQKVTVWQAKEFIKMQIEIQGSEDFLLRPLSRIIAIFSPRPNPT